MEYNVKITSYEGVIQTKQYDTKIIRGGKKHENDDENNRKKPNTDEQTFADDQPSTWHNPATGKVEIVPPGFMVDVDPFEMIPFLVPLPEYRPDEFMTQQELMDYVQKMLAKDKAKQKFINDQRNNRQTKNNIYEIAKANKWDLFVTITFSDQEKRYDLEEVKKVVRNKIKNLRKRKNLDFGYLLIPEEHKDGAWHLHGLFNDIDGLKLEKKRYPSGRLVKHDGKQVYTMPDFDNIGFNDCTFVEDTVRVAKYITKYITKQMENKYPGKKKYLVSKGLKRPATCYVNLEDMNDLGNVLEELAGYVPTKVFEKVARNPYTNTNVTYSEYKE